MNDPEAIVTTALPATGFKALDKALDAANIAVTLVMRVPSPLNPIADQVNRSASSAPANIAEGAGRSGGHRAHHGRIASAFAREVACHLRLLCVCRGVPSGKASTALNLFDDVRATTWRLLHPKA
jgi:four helix bundle protein